MGLTSKEYESIIEQLRHNCNILMKNNQEEPWYDRFKVWFKDLNLQNEIKYDPRIRQWFRYTNGYYMTISVGTVNTLLFEWGEFTNEHLSPSKTSFLRQWVEAECEFSDQWDPDPNIDNCLNGLVNKEERTLLPHTYEYPSKQQIQRNYDPDLDPIIPPLFHEMLQIIKNDQERAWFIQFLVNIVHHYFDEELFCIMYGPRNSGKSTLLRIFELVFGSQVVSKTQINKIGARFGFSECYDKLVNVNPDLPIVPLNDMTISNIKQMTGHDGMIEVELKGRDMFSYPIKCFLVFGINQLPGFKSSSEKEIESIFRRVFLINTPEKLETNPEFKKSTENPVFLDQLYSFLVWERPKAIIEDVDNWIDIQKEKWLDNSNPVLSILKEHYYYCDGREITCRDVFEYV